MSQGVESPTAYERALASHKHWLPLMVVAVTFSVLRPMREGAVLSVHLTPWVLLVATVAALPFALDRKVRRRSLPAPDGTGARLYWRHRGWALAWILAPLVAVAVGSGLYLAYAPEELDAFAVELGGSAQEFPRDIDIGLAVMWDCALIVGYGTALWMGVVAARWVFWTPTAAKVARFGRYCVVAAVVADLVENLLLVAAWRAAPESPNEAFLLDATSVAARIKFALLLPAVLVALVGVIVAAARLGGSRKREAQESPDWAQIGLVTPLPLEVPQRDEHPTAVGDPVQVTGDAAERRWAAAYEVPDVVVDGRASAFCMSGGGIRSACVSLGVLDVLRPKIAGVRYMISVSGGSYTNGALNQLLSAAPPEWLPKGGVAQGDLSDAYAPGSVEFNRLRRHSSYITSTPYEMIVALGVLARGLVASLALLFAPAVLLGIAVAWLYHAFPIAVLPHLTGEKVQTSSTQAPTSRLAGAELYVTPQAAWTAVFVTVLALSAWVWQLTRQAREAEPRRRPGPLARLARTILRRTDEDAVQRRAETHPRARRIAVFGTQAAVVVVLAVIGLPVLLWVVAWLASQFTERPQIGVGGAVGSVLLTYAASLAALLWRKRTSITGAVSKRRGAAKGATAAVPRGLLQLLLVVLTLAVLYAAWLLLFGLSASATVSTLDACDDVQAATCDATSPLIAAAGIAVLVVVLGALLDESSLSLHPFYRQRLASAFGARRVSVAGGPSMARPLDPHEPTYLSRFTGHREAPQPGQPPQEPIYVFGAAANLNADHRTPPGLNCVSYTFSSQWCGGPDVGWVRTQALENVVSPRLRRDLTVQSAVAVSGAAVSSAMGRNSGWYDLFLAISGVRLGAWLPNPSFLARMKAARDADGAVRDWTLPGLPHVRGMTFLLREVLRRHSANERLLLVSDGGHYENLGLVEALRRRCTTIYLADGGGDRPPTAQGLVEAIDLAYSELGVTITLDQPLESEPGSGAPLQPAAPFETLNAGLSRTPVLTGTITYPAASGLPEDRRVGRLYVARSTLWPSMPYSLLSYAVRHPEFPRDSTGDQWFDDGQFSAYTNLGRAMGRELSKAIVIDLRDQQVTSRRTQHADGAGAPVLD